MNWASPQMMRLGHGQTSLTATLDLSSVFDKNTVEAFDGTHGRTVKHHRDVLLVVLANILGTEALRQVEVHLDGTALPVTTEGVLQREFEVAAKSACYGRSPHYRVGRAILQGHPCAPAARPRGSCNQASLRESCPQGVTIPNAFLFRQNNTIYISIQPPKNRKFCDVCISFYFQINFSNLTIVP